MTNLGKLKDPNAILYFQNKTLLTTQSYKDLSAYEHAINFTVAKIANEDLLKTVKMALQSSIQDGVSFDEFKKNLLPYLNAQGWGNFSDNKNKLNHRLKIIYDTNRRTAYAHGQWARIQATKDVLPYLKYMPSTAKTKRDEHKRFYGLIRPVEDPIWQKLQPPSGFGCKCWIKQLTRREAQKEGVSAPFTDDEIKDLPDGLVSFDRLQNLLQVAKDKHGGEFADKLKERLSQNYPQITSAIANNHAITDDLSQSDIIRKWVNDDVRMEKWLDLYERLYKRQFNLTADEFIALRYYTANGYQGINRYLNGIDAPKEETKALFERIKPFLNDVIDKLPIDKKHKKLYRWLYLPDEVLEKYQTGEIVEFNAFTSTTHDKDKKVDLTGDSNVKFIIKHKTGRWIEQMSQHQSEKEVLLPTNTRHMVISRTQKKATKEYPAHTLIELEEIT